MERIPDDAIVVRGGRNLPEDIARGMGKHPSGVHGISVEAAAGVPLEQLAGGLPHTQIGMTSVAAVRSAGGDVIRTTGRSKYHATLTGLSPGTVSILLLPARFNPARQFKHE